MKKTVNKLGLCLLLLITLLAGCGTSTKSTQIAEQTKQEVSVLASMKTGAVSNESTLAYYEDIEAKWNEIMSANPPKQYLAGIEAQKDFASMMKTLLSQTNSDSKNTLETAFIGTEGTTDHEVTGIFIYHVTEQDTEMMTEQKILDANSFTEASKTGELIHKYQNYIITCDYGFIENYEEVFNIIDKQISEIK